MAGLESALETTVQTICDMKENHIDSTLISYYVAGAVNAIASYSDRNSDIVAWWIHQDVLDELEYRKGSTCS